MFRSRQLAFGFVRRMGYTLERRKLNRVYIINFICILLLRASADYITRFPYCTLKEIQRALLNLFSKKYPITSVHHMLRHLRISRKRVKRVVIKSKAYMRTLEAKRNAFIDFFRTIDYSNIISIDESGFHCEMSPEYGYSMREVTLKQTTSSQRHANNTLICAVLF